MRTLSGYGVRHEIICHDIQVSLPTLYKHYRADLDTGDSQAQGLIGQSMFDRGVNDKDTTALIWLTKTRMGWKDTSRIEFVGDPDNPVAVTFNYISPKAITDETK